MLSTIASFGIYWYLVFILQSFKVSTSSFEVCQAVHVSERMRVICLCIYYFMPTLILMYCYGFIFHHQHIDEISHGRKEVENERMEAEHESLAIDWRISRYKIYKLTAIMSLIFNIVITPYTMKEVFITIGGSKPSVFWDLCISWFGESYSLFNPLVIWCIDSHLRQLTKEVILEDVLCRRSAKSIPCCANSPNDVSFNIYRNKEVPISLLDKNGLFKSNYAPSSKTIMSSLEYPLAHHRKSTKPPCYIENGEKHWGEILEKSLSVRNIHNWNKKQDVSSILLDEKTKLQSISLNHVENS
nr:uncharacterized protein LOC121125352 [Lepeophtheirus salmonis]